jgi:16S rRNA (uracil1498-N3)-methyltransferase
MRRRFFVGKFEDQRAAMHGETAHHLSRVLRARPGQLYELSDGTSVWLGRIDIVTRDRVDFALLERLPSYIPQLQTTLLLSVVKFDAFEWALEKATELGVEEIVPLAAERSERALVAAAGKRAERWKRILSESAQQARRLRIPSLRDAAKPRDAFRASSASVKLLMSERPGVNPLREILDPVVSETQEDTSTALTIAIGPEGGWTDAELASASQNGFVEAALGANILRTETAVCAALAAAQYAFGAYQAGKGRD